MKKGLDPVAFSCFLSKTFKCRIIENIENMMFFWLQRRHKSSNIVEWKENNAGFKKYAFYQKITRNCDAFRQQISVRVNIILRTEIDNRRTEIDNGEQRHSTFSLALKREVDIEENSNSNVWFVLVYLRAPGKDVMYILVV